MPSWPVLLVLVLTGLTPQISTGTSFYELGTRISTDVPGKVTALRFWRTPDDPGPHVGRLWSSSGIKLAEARFVEESASGWQEQTLSVPVAVAAGSVIIASVNTVAGSHYPILPVGFAMPLLDGHVTYRSGAYTGTPGGYPVGSAPSNYFRDIVFQADPSISIGSGSVSLDPLGSISLDGFSPGSTLKVEIKVTDDAGNSASGSGVLTIPSEPR